MKECGERENGECDEYPGGGVGSTESLDSDDCGDSERVLNKFQNKYCGVDGQLVMTAWKIVQLFPL